MPASAKTVLIIDDEATVRQCLSQFLEKTGYSVLTARDGAEGLAKIFSANPDIVLLDLMMPGMNGYEVLAKARQWSEHLPVIVISATTSVEDAVKALREGASDYLVKPIGDIKLVGYLIQRVLERKRLIEDNQRTREKLEKLIKEREEDIAQRRETEKELTDTLDELKRTQSYLVQNEKMASIGQLAAGVAHEINNPIGFISSNLATMNKYVVRISEYDSQFQELKKGLREREIGAAGFCSQMEQLEKKLKIRHIIDDLPEVIRESLEGADRVKKIVADLKSFSHLDQGEFKPADINEGIETTLNVVWNEIKYKCAVEKEYDDLPLVSCNHSQLNQVFMNLLVNASQAIEDKGTIYIKTEYDAARDEQKKEVKGWVIVTIKDTGNGIPDEHIEKIFEPFFTTKDVGLGTGLGLSIAYDIIKKHSGTIEVSSKKGSGTAFSIRLPVFQEVEHHAA